MSLLKIVSARLYSHPLRTRMPFRFGIADVRQVPHLFVRLTLERGGKRAEGVAADHLVPKWFTKNPQSSYEDDIAEMTGVALAACRIAEEAASEATPFRLWRAIYDGQSRRAQASGWPPLLASLGSSLIERALIDAFCRLEGIPFGTALRENRLGIDLGTLYPELAGLAPAAFLPAAPATSVSVRHTVGLSDPLTAADLAGGTWPDDGLPVSLEECIGRYGLSSFKIKISDDTERNLDRLRAITALLHAKLGGAYTFSLDGNESYRRIADFAAFWEKFQRVSEEAGWRDRLLYVEQPLHRDVALADEVGAVFAGCAQPPRMIIDESDATLDTLERGLACGYAGTTHKNCKGIFKSVANLALLKHRFPAPGGFLFSGEDLTNVGPVALLEDLCVAQNLGLDNLERNGHHYFRGLAGFPRALWGPVAEAHPDLFETLPDGCPTARIEGGRMRGTSLLHAGLGPAFALPWEHLTPVE